MFNLWEKLSYFSYDILNIINGEYPTFKWDKDGIDAYDYTIDNQGTFNPNFNKFVRFDRFGLYGYDGSSTFVPTSENDIWGHARFGLTWNGFFLKNLNNGSGVEISSDNDIVVKVK